MKLLSAFSLILLFSLKLSAQQFTLTGHLTGIPDSKIFIYYANPQGKNTIDSAAITNGNFTLNGGIAGDVMAYVYAGGKSATNKKFAGGNVKQIFLSPRTMNVSGDFENLSDLRLSGSKSNDEFEKLNEVITLVNKQNEPIRKNYDVLNREYAQLKKANEDDPKLKPLGETLDSLRDVINEPYYAAVKKFISENKSSYVSAYYLNVYKGSWPLGEVKKLYNSLKAGSMKGSYYDQIREYFEKIESKTAKNFTATDVNGKPLNLADFKGKYVILDFWASWCVPCRASTPHLIATYNKYHQKGLNIIAISDDDSNPKAWQSAIKKDGSGIWHNVLRGYKGIGAESPNDILNIFTVSVLPTKILIGKDGTILGRYVGTEDTEAFDKKLEEIFGK